MELNHQPAEVRECILIKYALLPFGKGAYCFLASFL